MMRHDGHFSTLELSTKFQQLESIEQSVCYLTNPLSIDFSCTSICTLLGTLISHAGDRKKLPVLRKYVDSSLIGWSTVGQLDIESRVSVTSVSSYVTILGHSCSFFVLETVRRVRLAS